VKNGKRDFEKAFIFAVLFATLACVSIGTASVAEPHYVNSGESIQGAIDNATAGDTIIVRDGMYTENVNVNVDHLTIKSEHGYDSTVVHAANTSDHVFEVTADYVNITGFTVTDATGAASDYIYTCGIQLYQAEHCIISDNNALNNWRGIYLVYSSNNSLTGNTASNNTYSGIYLSSSCNYNTLTDNNVKNNTNNARDSGNNRWNITKTAGTNIIGGPYIGGNYGSDYRGEDLTEDGLGDTLVPYNSSGKIANGGDLLPLVKPSASSVFATGAGTYPSIMGTHEGKIMPSRDIAVSKLYTYSCAGTGGYTKTIE
jgi:parallel beta-helix repeat protein